MAGPTTSDDGRAIVVEARGLNHSYGTGHRKVDVLFDIDMEVREGEIVIVTGPSGSGKTTLLTILGTMRRPMAAAEQVVVMTCSGRGCGCRSGGSGASRGAQAGCRRADARAGGLGVRASGQKSGSPLPGVPATGRGFWEGIMQNRKCKMQNSK